jgi:hypothetical protein
MAFIGLFCCMPIGVEKII